MPIKCPLLSPVRSDITILLFHVTKLLGWGWDNKSVIGFEGSIWDLVVSVPDHCLSFYFTSRRIKYVSQVSEITWVRPVWNSGVLPYFNKTKNRFDCRQDKSQDWSKFISISLQGCKTTTYFDIRKHNTSMSNEPSHQIMALLVLRKLNSSNTHAQPSSGARCLIFGRALRLLPYSMCANSEGSGETARMHMLTLAFTGRLCDKHHNLMSWLKLSQTWSDTVKNITHNARDLQPTNCLNAMEFAANKQVLYTLIFICIFFLQKVSNDAMILLELFCLLIKNMTAVFCHSLDVMQFFGKKR